MNLWAESDNPELASTPSQQPRKPGPSVGTRFIASSHATATNAILPALRAWLLADYVAPYCRSLAATRIFRRCIWLDALASMRVTSKKTGGSQGRDERERDERERDERGRDERGRDEHGRDATGRDATGRDERGRDESRPYMFDDVTEREQFDGSASRTNKAAQKPRSEALPPALQAVAALADELARENKPITLQGIALDNAKNGGTRLIASASSSPGSFVLPKESSVIPASWRDVAPALLPVIEQTATIFLLNPLAITKSLSSQLKERGRPQGSLPVHSTTPAPAMNGVPFLTADELAPLFQRTAPTEICLLLMHQQVERVFLPALRSSAGAAAFTALLRSDRWKAVLAKESKNNSKINKAIDLWLASLQPHFPMARHIAFPLLIGPAAVEDAPCSLLFATRRQDSLACMNDAICGYRRRLEQESRRGILNEAWFAAQQAERDAQALQQLSEDILREGRARLPRRWPDLRQQFLLDRFGQWMLSDYDEVICRLLQADDLRCEWRRPNHADFPYRVPGPEDMLQWQWKKRRY